MNKILVCKNEDYIMISQDGKKFIINKNNSFEDKYNML